MQDLKASRAFPNSPTVVSSIPLLYLAVKELRLKITVGSPPDLRVKGNGAI